MKEVRATFSATPGIEAIRPVNKTSIPNLFLAGDWTRSGWPSTMEGAVRSGYLAAEAVTEFLGSQTAVPDSGRERIERTSADSPSRSSCEAEWIWA